MSPARAKEYLMLGREYTGAELEQLGVINRAVPAGDLDDLVRDVVNQLLRRGAYALARTKRMVNRHVAQHLNLVLDGAIGYEMVDLYQHRWLPQ